MGDYGYDPSTGQGYYGSPGASYFDDGSSSLQMNMHPPVVSYYPSAGDPSRAVYDMYEAPVQGAYGAELYSRQLLQHYKGQPTALSLAGTAGAATAKKGSFCPHSEILPTQLDGYPVSALAYDASYQAIYMASTTQNVSTTRFKSHRASMLVTHSTADGMLHSSVAGHPEASPSTLQTVYECIFGIPKTVPILSRSQQQQQHIPPHAYRAPYGSSQVDTTIPATAISMPTSATSPSIKHGHIGITAILPLSNGYAATISPAAIRIHAHGGMQLHDYDMEGMMCGTIHPHSGITGGPTHISVGGIPCRNHPVDGGKHPEKEVFCMDLWQGLRVISSRSFTDRYDKKVGVTAMATSHDRGTVVAGCSDGYLRVLDGALREVATVKSHKGGVSSMSISPDGMLIATTGYSSKIKGKETSVLYAFPDPTVYIYDIRCLGRGGIPHPFAGLRGSPRHVAFVPDLEGLDSNRLLVASGQTGGGLQVIVPFEAHNDKSGSFLTPQLDQGESITAMAQTEEDLALGTSLGRVLTYKCAGYSKVKLSSNSAKKALVMPSYIPPLPPISIDAKVLLSGSDPDIRGGSDEKARALLSNFLLQSDAKLSFIGDSPQESTTQFGPLGKGRIISTTRRAVASAFLGVAEPAEGDFIATIPSSQLEVDLLADHNTVSKRYKGKKTRDSLPNPNKFLYNQKLASLCYDDGGRRKYRSQRPRGSSGDSQEELPKRYRLQLRPHFRSSGAFDPCDFNDTGLIPGWDYPPTMPNSFAPPVLLMLYFVPELLSALLGAQYNEYLFSVRGYEKALSPELGFIFHQIESLAANGLLYPTKPGVDAIRARIGAWVPSNFMTALATMPEAEQLQVLDDSPAAVEAPRRPEAFYRFLTYQLDKELSKNANKKLLDSLHGIDFLSSNQFITGSSPPTQSTSRAMTLDLSYDIYTKGEVKNAIKFGELLQHSLCRETRLRAWNAKSKAYETIVQRKIVTSLPQILSIACSCAGRKEEDGLWVWRTSDEEPWLPELIEVELDGDANIVVKQLNNGGSVEESWSTFSVRSDLPLAVSKLVAEVSAKQRRRYRLDAVLSFITADSDDRIVGHHILHARMPAEYKTRILRCQKDRVQKIIDEDLDPNFLTLISEIEPGVLRRRFERVQEDLEATTGSDSDSWVLYNGFAICDAVAEDARAFHGAFKEPCLLLYRDVDDNSETFSSSTEIRIPSSVMTCRSLSTVAAKSSYKLSNIRKGKFVAFDAEFVSVQEEETNLSDNGSKVVLRETRHSVARISVIDCETRQTIIDDHVVPKEHVVDYLTRFSGIVADDLDPSKASHSLISTRNAYLKLRYLMEQGCIFVGHGLRQDFATVNLVVPPNQIVDTVEIYHQRGMRFISLRFLANHVLGRDMQQDIHDSVEDAVASFELYETALGWKQQGVFEKKLQEIYVHGEGTDWKIGVGA